MIFSEGRESKKNWYFMQIYAFFHIQVFFDKNPSHFPIIKYYQIIDNIKP